MFEFKHCPFYLCKLNGSKLSSFNELIKNKTNYAERNLEKDSCKVS